MKTIIDFFDKTLAIVSEGAVSIAAVAALLVALIGSVDVLTSRVFSQAIPGAFELSEVGLVLIVFLGMAVVTKEGGHIKVDIVVNRLNARWQSYCNVFGCLLTTAFLGLMTRQMWFLAQKSWKISEMATGLFPFPIYPVKIAAFIGLTAASIEAFRRLIQAIWQAAFSGKKDQT